MSVFFALSFLWFFRTARSVLFWLYLWQLKDYHLGRFLDHFRTAKGQQIFLNWLFLSKLFLIATFFFYSPLSILLVFILYFFESLKTLVDFFGNNLKRPVFTPKITLLAWLGFAATGLVFFVLLLSFSLQLEFFVLSLVALDLLVPLVISLLILSFQPLTLLARGRIIAQAKKKRASFPNLAVIGITGSYGKTSTKEFLATILSEKFNVLKTKEHQNSEVGVSQCILRELRPEHEVFVCEIGAYGRGGIKLLCDIAKPKIGILTGISEQHMSTFGSQEKIIKTKFELIESLPGDGIAVVNADNHFIKSNIPAFAPLSGASVGRQRPNLRINPNLQIVRYSVSGKEDIWAENIKVERQYIAFQVVTREGDKADFKINLYGAHNISNILAAAAAAKYIGMSLSEVAKACEKIRPEQSGMQLKEAVSGATIIDATYSANPDGVASHLEYLKLWPAKKIIIMPCLIELGRASKEVHSRLGRKIGETCDLAIITTQERFDELRKGAMETGMEKREILFSEDAKEISEKIKQFSLVGAAVLLEGRIKKTIKDAVLK